MFFKGLNRASASGRRVFHGLRALGGLVVILFYLLLNATSYQFPVHQLEPLQALEVAISRYIK